MKNLPIIFILCIASLFCCANPDNKNKKHVVYSHGFGETGSGLISWKGLDLGDSYSAPTYPDAPGMMTRASLYTKAAVHTLSNHLYDKVIVQGLESIILVGFSCGAGTMFNCLEKLINYDPHYFKDSKITSTDADKIVAAINKGALISTAPLLALRKGNIVIIPASILTGLTVFAATALSYYYYAWCCSNSTDKDSQKKEDAELPIGENEKPTTSATDAEENQKSSIKIEKKHLIKTAIVLGGAMIYWFLGNVIKQAYIYSMVNWMAPRITNYNFDPKHADPLESIEKLRRKITCPILLHFNKKDGIVENPDQDTVNIYEALKGDKTHISITDDSWHNGFSEEFLQTLPKFYTKYLSGSETSDIDMSATQPTVDELKKQIYTFH